MWRLPTEGISSQYGPSFGCSRFLALYILAQNLRSTIFKQTRTHGTDCVGISIFLAHNIFNNTHSKPNVRPTKSSSCLGVFLRTADPVGQTSQILKRRPRNAVRGASQFLAQNTKCCAPHEKFWIFGPKSWPFWSFKLFLDITRVSRRKSVGRQQKSTFAILDRHTVYTKILIVLFARIWVIWMASSRYCIRISGKYMPISRTPRRDYQNTRWIPHVWSRFLLLIVILFHKAPHVIYAVIYVFPMAVV